jgi:hypothetical protein
MTSSQAAWLALTVAVGILVIAMRIHEVWNQTDVQRLSEHDKAIQARNCTDVGGWPEITDYDVICHELTRLRGE